LRKRGRYANYWERGLERKELKKKGVHPRKERKKGKKGWPGLPFFKEGARGGTPSTEDKAGRTKRDGEKKGCHRRFNPRGGENFQSMGRGGGGAERNWCGGMGEGIFQITRRTNLYPLELSRENFPADEGEI